MTTIASLRDSVPKLFLLVESSLKRCVAFTSGCEAEALCSSVIQVVMDEYFGHFKTLVVHLRQLAGLDSTQQSEAIKKKRTRRPTYRTMSSHSQFKCYSNSNRWRSIP